MPGVSWPVEAEPPNVTCTGPMTLSLGTVSEQGSELANWLTTAPTVLINLGGGFEYSVMQATAMAQAIARVLKETDVQILWKVRMDCVYGDDLMSPLVPFTDNGRVRVVRWLAADPPSLLESGHVIASVHHGGSGCYHEAISAGVPQVVLPLWLDLYGLAQLTESIGVGVWRCRKTSPQWTAECLQEAILRVVSSNGSQSFREKSRDLGLRAQESPGRYVAAPVIVVLAGSGAFKPKVAI
ncbi:Uu.00g085410.m01.CDS01 [Anthostomella pinea]|uniref:Uu.00g085410.m01.CDS01 n=1 Tax=Anthostomella pinea TaxID=933095 RepID=A0AAI8VLX8_9PEZI|nr:Uu.00g085410.m01.CDS01 [Anthostomella pinea]